MLIGGSCCSSGGKSEAGSVGKGMRDAVSIMPSPGWRSAEEEGKTSWPR